MKTDLFLESLNLRNFATFENQEISFHKSFNGIVGETGSGKSLILDAFQLLLGARADKKLVRKDSDCAVIEGVFSIKGESSSQYFDEIGYPLDESEMIVVKRIIYPTGKSKAFLNHQFCSLNVLNKFSKRFVDLVGQFENQKLANQDYQLKLLDQFAKVETLVSDYKELYEKYSTLHSAEQSLTIKVNEKAQREDYLKFQMNELKDLSPSIERENQLIESKNRIKNKEGLSLALEDIKVMTTEGDNNILSLLKNCQRRAEELETVLPKGTLEQLGDITSLFEDFSFSISKTDLESDEEITLEDILEELDRYQKAKRKFSCETDRLEEIFTDIEKELHELSLLDSELEKVQKEKAVLENKLYKIAKDLHTKRNSKKGTLEKSISEGLRDLNMSGATFKIQVHETETLGPTGISRVNFLAETNPGEGFFKINEIASGGELSRILLCLRQIVASDDTINIFFFDEIDTGIGGETAIKIADALQKVAKHSQVLAITHLPQIARTVDEIIFVAKKSLEKDTKKRTISFVENKTGKEREEVINTLAGLL